MTTMTMTLGGFRAPRLRPPRINARRVVAIAVVVALHVFAFGRMLLPTPPKASERGARVELPIPIPRDVPPPPPPPPRVITPVPKIIPPIVTPPRPQERRPIDPPPQSLPQQAHVADRGEERAPPPVPTVAPSGPPVAAKPAAAELVATVATAPQYPAREQRLGIQGSARLRILVGVDGRAREVEVLGTKGSPAFGRAARQQVMRRWRFQPAEREGRAVEAWGTVTILFRL